MTGSADDAAAYGRVFASDYDELYDDRSDVDGILRTVGELAPGGRVLEFGVGTGRVAVPMVDAGHEVVGVDASPDMLARLHARPGAERITAVEADFCTVSVDGLFDIVLIAFSTLFLVPTQEQQIACLANARNHLRPGGFLALDAFVPDHSRWTRNQNLSIAHLDGDGVTLKLSVHDPVRQVIDVQDVQVGKDGMSLRPNRLRYAWPAELDAMAVAGGLEPYRRWTTWNQDPFTAGSTTQVSVYRRRDGDR